VTSRIGPEVRKERYGSLDEAIDALEREAAGVGGVSTTKVLGREYEPAAQVAGRFELAGPGGARGGIDVRGDGSAEAFRGRVRKQVVERRDGETAAQALRRVLLACVALAGLLLVCASAAAAATLTVDAGADRRPISEDVYGMNFADPALAAEVGLPVNRFGGNTTDSYNWQHGSWNTGNDWYFENTASCWNDAHGWCGNPATHGARKHLEHLSADRARGTRTLLTVPMMGWVAKDNPTARPTCAFPTSQHGAQQDRDPYWPDCGNGRDALGNPLTANRTTAGAQIDPAPNATALLGDLAARDRRPALVGLGNEPMLWSSTHRHWHPEPATFDELEAKSVAVATAVKDAQPTAQTLGPSEWGWTNYFCSAADHTADGCQPTDSDRAAHGGKELVAWYLERMKAASDSAGRRLLDYFALHYYAMGGDNTPDITRSLWDPAYTDPSWVADEIELLPRMKRWIAANYPGTKLALTEYDLTIRTSDPVLQTIIQADTLGILVREGVDLATRWSPPAAGELEADAWRIFRNYDGEGGRFGSTWVRSVSSDQGAVAVYAAERADGALTVLAVNKSAAPQPADVRLAGFAPAGPATPWRWAGPGGITEMAPQAVGADGRFSAVLPGRSMTLYVVPGEEDDEDPVIDLPDLPPVPGLPLPPGGQRTAADGGAPASPAVVASPPSPRAIAERRRCVVPNLRGLTAARARRALRAAGCGAAKVRRRTVARRTARGRVVGQSPKPGARVLPTRTVTVVVGRAPAKRRG
jgi:hypothetical protein